MLTLRDISTHELQEMLEATVRVAGAQSQGAAAIRRELERRRVIPEQVAVVADKEVRDAR